MDEGNCVVSWWCRQEDAMTKDPKDALVAVVFSVSPPAIRETSHTWAERGEA